MSINNDIILRPRFKIELDKNNQEVLNVFEDAKNTQKNFIVSRIDDHVFIKIPKADQHFWSPQLHLEIMEVDKNSSRLFGLFGPNPTVWTMFMFFYIAVSFITVVGGFFGLSQLQLGHPAPFLWCWLFGGLVLPTIYIASKIGQKKGRDQMLHLVSFVYHSIAQKGDVTRV